MCVLYMINFNVTKEKILNQLTLNVLIIHILFAFTATSHDFVKSRKFSVLEKTLIL